MAAQPFVIDGVTVKPLPRIENPLVRLALGPFIAFYHAFKDPARIVHFHDPELIPVALLLHVLGKTIIYDIHENLREGLKEKRWIPLKGLFLPLFFQLEAIALKRFHVIIAETSYEGDYRNRCRSLTTVLNFPRYEDFAPFQIKDRAARPAGIRLFYIGGVTKERGILALLRSIKILKEREHQVQLDCVGPILASLMSDKEFVRLCDELSDQVTFHGRLSIIDGYKISKRANIGVCILMPIANYLRSYPTKLFEYMAVGLPFITSNFQLYREVVRSSGCGITVNPEDPSEIADRIYELSQSASAQDMVNRGIQAAESRYNWSLEEKKLAELYDRIAD